MTYRVVCRSSRQSFENVGDAVDFAEAEASRVNRGALLYQLMHEYGQDIFRTIATYDSRYGWRGAIGTPPPKKEKVQPRPPMPFTDPGRANIEEF